MCVKSNTGYRLVRGAVMGIGGAKVQDEPCDEYRCDAVEGNVVEWINHINKILQCTHASATRTKYTAVMAPSGPRTITHNSKLTVFNANRALTTPISRARKVYSGKDAHAKYKVPEVY